MRGAQGDDFLVVSKTSEGLALAATEQPRHGLADFDEVAADGRLDRAGIVYIVCAMTRRHQNSPGADRTREIQITTFVSDHEGSAGDEIEISRGGIDHPGKWLSAGAPGLGTMGAHVPPGHFDSFIGEQLREPDPHGFGLIEGEIAASDSRLIGDDDQGRVSRHGSQSCGGAVEQDDLIGIGEIVLFFDDRAVAVEEYRGSLHVTRPCS
jgi:hypothetical protein